MDVLEGYSQGKSHQEYKIEQGSEKVSQKSIGIIIYFHLYLGMISPI